MDRFTLTLITSQRDLRRKAARVKRTFGFLPHSRANVAEKRVAPLVWT
jgi:hypothetical protein